MINVKLNWIGYKKIVGKYFLISFFLFSGVNIKSDTIKFTNRYIANSWFSFKRSVIRN